jgi:hypothetical protein
MLLVAGCPVSQTKYSPEKSVELEFRFGKRFHSCGPCVLSERQFHFLSVTLTVMYPKENIRILRSRPNGDGSIKPAQAEYSCLSSRRQSVSASNRMSTQVRKCRGLRPSNHSQLAEYVMPEERHEDQISGYPTQNNSRKTVGEWNKSKHHRKEGRISVLSTTCSRTREQVR